MLKITDAQFIISAPSLKEAPDWQFSEIALVGRSNVGKSSFINTLSNRKKLAKTSNTPGKTRLMNFYLINERFSFVDLPGYGYAKVSKTEQAKWKRHLEAYLAKRKNLVLAVQLIDARHGMQESDEQMLAWLMQHEIPVVVILTKADKISRNDLGRQAATLCKQLDLEPDELLTFSAETGWGKDAVLAFLDNYLKTA